MFVVIEGIDGAGKSTMVDELYNYAVRVLKLKTIKLKFPDYVSPWGEIITNYLEGNYRQDLSPWLINILYDCDKFAYKPVLESHLRHNDLVILDRYYLSNIAYSCARTKHLMPEDEIIDNLTYLNCEIFQLPKPDITFIMTISEERYLEIKHLRAMTRGNDILEDNLELLKDAQNIYKKFGNFDIGLTKEVPYVPIEDRLQFMVNEIGNLRL